MPFDKESKWKLIEDLQTIHRNGQILEIQLRFAGKTKQAEQVWSENVRLSQEVDLLIGRAIEKWLGDAGSPLATVADASRRLQAAIADIKRTVKTAQAIVTAVGCIDEAVKIAAKLAKHI